jgi:catechol 2,3-dioxygenase-like lactoylglutathione lyase family enzyme
MEVLIMKATGLDRVIFYVRDMDKALAFFSGELGFKFKELDEKVQQQDGNRGCVCREAHLHLVQPFDPLPETAPPPMKYAAQVLKEKEALVMLLVFKVKDAKKGAKEMKERGFTIVRTWEDTRDYASVGMDNLSEFLLDSKDTLGVPMCFASWDEV